jgi:polyhydroxyalkanoate synthesis regulator phasin
MSKLLHTFATIHLPHIAAKMTPENGYRPEAHSVAADLVADGVITAEEGKHFEDCIAELAAQDDDTAKLLQAAASGKDRKDNLENLIGDEIKEDAAL